MILQCMKPGSVGTVWSRDTSVQAIIAYGGKGTETTMEVEADTVPWMEQGVHRPETDEAEPETVLHKLAPHTSSMG